MDSNFSAKSLGMSKDIAGLREPAYTIECIVFFAAVKPAVLAL